jgi:hypothetical protein
MSEKHTREYRKSKIVEMRKRSRYRGEWHYGFTFGSALVVAVWSLLHLRNPVSGDFMIVPAMIIYANFIEYFVHRFLLHHRIPGLGILYERHAIQHHRYFTDRDISILSRLQMYYVLFPAVAILVFIPLAAGPISYGIGCWLGANAGWMALLTSGLYFAWYETFHLANHLPLSHAVHRIPGLSALCRFHRLHHHPAAARKYNFNVTFPLADWCLGTLKTGK